MHKQHTWPKNYRIVVIGQLEDPEFVLPGRVDAYHDLLEDAYAAFGKIETRVDELGQQLEAEHTRLDEGVKTYG